MPRGSVPWPQRGGGAAPQRTAATRGGGSQTAGRPAVVQPAATTTTMATADVTTVHLVDACGRVIDIRPEVTADATPSSDDRGADLTDGGGGGGESEDDDRRKSAAALVAGCPPRVRGEHIPPGKRA